MQAEIVIVGAGLAGGATAYHLHQLGMKDVVLLEQASAPGEHSSGRNAAMVRERLSDPDMQALNSEGAMALRSGKLATFRRTGSVLIGWGDDDAARYFPLASGRGSWNADDGVTDPAGLLHAYLRGQRVFCDTRMTGWESDDDGIAIRTTRGPMRTRLLVNAAGPWAGGVGSLPLTPRNRHLFLTPSMPAVNPDWPFVWDIGHGVYFRPEGGGLLLCPCDEEARQPGDYRVNHEVASALGEILAKWQPRLKDVAVRICWTGQRTFAADRKFVIGHDPRDSRLFHVAGLGGHGVTASYAVGRMAAELILGQADPRADRLSPARLLGIAQGSNPRPIAVDGARRPR